MSTTTAVTRTGEKITAEVSLFHVRTLVLPQLQEGIDRFREVTAEDGHPAAPAAANTLREWALSLAYWLDTSGTR